MSAKKRNIWLHLLLVAIAVIVWLIFSGIIILGVLALTDYIFSSPPPPHLDNKYGKKLYAGQMWERASWAKIITIYALTAGSLLVFYFLSVREKAVKDDETLTLLETEGGKISDNAAAETDGVTFNSSFEVDKTKFDGEFYVQNSPEKNSSKKIITAAVKFRVENCSEAFYIEKQTARKTSAMLSILPAPEINSMQKIEEKYDYGYSEYKFFNEFMVGEKIIDDLLVNYGSRNEYFKITFQNQEFAMECRKTITADEYEAQDAGAKLLQRLSVRAKKYYERFQAIDKNKSNL